jgi:hypothetical protein
MRNWGEGGAMKKKASAKKISEKTRKQAMEKKIKKALTTPQKSSAKTKKGKTAKPGVKTKKPSPKKSTVVAAKKPPAKKSTVAAAKKPLAIKSAVAAAKKPKTVAIKKQEKTGKALKKVTPKIAIETEKVRKKTAGKKEKKPPVTTKKKIAKAPPEKSAKKIRAAAAKETPVKNKPKKAAEKPAAKKISPAKTQRVSAKKPAEKPKRIAAAKVKPEKKEQQAKAAKKIRAEAPHPAPAAEKEKEQKKTAPLPEPKTEAEKEPAAVKKEPPVSPEKITLYPPVPWETLPSEYGENAITLMPVNPFRLFVFWEVRENALKMFKGELIIRTYDATDINIDKAEANSFFDCVLSDRIGSRYLDVNPGRQYISDIGILYEGIFVSVARSNAVETPRATPAAEGALPVPRDETGMRIGY